MAVALVRTLTVIPRRMIPSRCVMFAIFIMGSAFAASAPATPAKPNSAAAGCGTTPGSYNDGDEVASGGGNDGTTQYGYFDFRKVTTPDGCCAACKKNKDCNEWRFCDQTDGCCDSSNKATGCTPDVRLPKNFCTLRKATGYYQFKNLKATFFNGSAHSFVSGKLEDRAPKEEIHPPAVPNEWKCSVDYYCTIVAPEYCPNNSTTCAPSSCGAQRGLVGQNAKIVNHEVNSFEYHAGPNHPPQVTSAASCCSACTSSKQCNVWNYCWDPLGCGEPQSCSAYVNEYPSGADSKAVRGQFADSCTADGRFPQFFCILRHADGDLKRLTANGSKGAYSWTSGTKTA